MTIETAAIDGVENDNVSTLMSKLETIQSTRGMLVQFTPGGTQSRECVCLAPFLSLSLLFCVCMVWGFTGN